MLDRVRHRVWGLSGRLIASYILVTLAVVVLVEVLVLCFQVLPLVKDTQLQAQLQAQVDATAKSYGQRLAHRYPGGLPTGILLGDPGQPAADGGFSRSHKPDQHNGVAAFFHSKKLFASRTVLGK